MATGEPSGVAKGVGDQCTGVSVPPREARREKRPLAEGVAPWVRLEEEGIGVEVLVELIAGTAGSGEKQSQNEPEARKGARQVCRRCVREQALRTYAGNEESKQKR